MGAKKPSVPRVTLRERNALRAEQLVEFSGGRGADGQSIGGLISFRQETDEDGQPTHLVVELYRCDTAVRVIVDRSLLSVRCGDLPVVKVPRKRRRTVVQTPTALLPGEAIEFVKRRRRWP